MKRFTNLPFLLYVLYLIFFLSTVCALRVVTSMSIGLILLISIFQNKKETGSYFSNRLKNIFLLGCVLFFLIQLIALSYTNDVREGLKHLSVKSGLVIIPLALCCSYYPDAKAFQMLMKRYCIILAMAIVACLIIAGWKYFFLDMKNTVFFYHELVKPFKQHAIQFSILVFTGLIFLLETIRKGQYVFNRRLDFLLLSLFILFLILLSSKLIIIFTILYIVYYLFVIYKKNKGNRLWLAMSVLAGAIVICIVFFTKNLVSDRFNEIVSGDMNQIRREKFNQGVYFNGLQFRLLQWRFVSEILTEHHAWLAGVTPGDAQSFLDKKYVDTDMYTGIKGTPERGFLGYNTHNQFLESLLQTGMLGLLMFLLICYGMIDMAVRRKNKQLSAIIILLIAYSLNEAVFETQYGIVLFTFLPLLMYFGESEARETGK